jgi:hypothetical protein
MKEFNIVSKMQQPAACGHYEGDVFIGNAIASVDDENAYGYIHCKEKCTLTINPCIANIKYRFKNVDEGVLQKAVTICHLYSNSLYVFIWALKQNGAEVADYVATRKSDVYSSEEIDIGMTKHLLEEIEDYIKHHGVTQGGPSATT